MQVKSSLVAVSAFSAVAIAYGVQQSMHLEPCTLCILVRYAFLMVAVLALVDMALDNFIIRGLYSVSATLGAAVAVRHLWILDHPSTTCGRDMVADWLNALPTATWWPAMFESTGLCGDKIPPLLGLSFPLWGLVGFVVVLLITWTPTPSSGEVSELMESAVDLVD